ncbi:DUF421 domain-containing protein [Deinococcus pimensis]|uniref:DUF421 domain-containing protein n=1 Tax=Deinococcus pimensis TaxID=309888 RepID=UPI0004B15D43|nr:YetF domain-containing protein [Deinococcus pimensis]
MDMLDFLLGHPQVSGGVTYVVALRAVIVYAFTLFLVRLGSPRFLSQATAIDVIVGIMLGSVMSRAVNGSGVLLPTLAAGLVLITLHWLLDRLSLHVRWFGPLVKGLPIPLIVSGVVQSDGMRRAGLSRRDLEEALRLRGVPDDPSRVVEAYLERNGAISVVLASREPSVSTSDGRSVKERPA